MAVNMSTDIEYLSATELSAGFAAGSISPVAATAAALAAIDAQDGAFNAFRLVDAEAAPPPRLNPNAAGRRNRH